MYTHHLRCPMCNRKTAWVSRTGGRVGKPYIPSDCLRAATSDGTCTTCDRQRRGVVRKVPDGELHKGRYRARQVISDEEVARLRGEINRMWLDRRRRGVPVEGIDTRDWAHGNGGLYASEIP